ncbi:MAG TPA: 2-dehydropantoate 2-reductase [Thermodesulforhabdus norvegica]|uniref:2-dehydropantoate 2-reductase n=1 Tax=Thermodesulforhabdus norvegica TaxID=39841 RepID=A0A7C0WVB4_9BACT|nr:MAG: 2-dehydropantoate 2-reductase [Deltaproteobacteria bacterium]RLC15551.1 MAG: 2-dehydropantoate 2-reductase [Deltaproteobacteria bacterium]HDL89885.1 2-dehydropantoate 2-reductase [Thermodesulforhabdus norvegica]
MRIAIFGAGSIGGYFGGRLSQAGEDVIFLARGDHLKAMLTHGLRVDSINGDFVLQQVQATDDPSKIGKVDMVLVGVKAWQVSEAAQTMRAMIGPETFVLPLQNGIEAPTLLSEILGSQHVLGGLCGLFCYVAGPGHIVHAGTDPFIKFGELDNHRSQRVELLLETFTRVGINTEIPTDIQVAMWMKFLFITVWSGIGAVTRSPVGIWRSLPETRQMAKQGLLEIIAVAKSRNISLPVEALQTAMGMYDGLAPQSTASLQRDIMDKRPSELEAQIGAVVRFGQESNVTTPQHTFIYQSLLPMELQARGQLQVNE